MAERKKTARAAWEAFDRLPEVEAARDSAIADAARLTDERDHAIEAFRKYAKENKELHLNAQNLKLSNKVLAGKVSDLSGKLKRAESKAGWYFMGMISGLIGIIAALSFAYYLYA